jgi:hypothetical protein
MNVTDPSTTGMDRTPDSFGRDSCKECDADLDPLPYTLGTVECPDCGAENGVVT